MGMSIAVLLCNMKHMSPCSGRESCPSMPSMAAAQQLERGPRAAIGLKEVKSCSFLKDFASIVNHRVGSS